MIRTLEEAQARQPHSNLAVISVPGEYAAREARRALERGLHVFLFSDNVPLERERSLKEYARDHGLIVMGPDCGTAIIGGVGIGFANVVRRGPSASSAPREPESRNSPPSSTGPGPASLTPSARAAGIFRTRSAESPFCLP